MDPLQYLVAPRRPLPSPRSKARDGVLKNMFPLPATHQLEPVLTSSPRSYMIAHASNKLKESAESATTAATLPSEIPVQPQRPKSREDEESTKCLRPQPPTGLSSRTDVDIYRYSQAMELRMAIEPLFERRRGAGARITSAKRKTKKQAAFIESKSVAENLEDGRASVSQPENEENRVQLDEENEVVYGNCNQEGVSTRSPTLGDYIAVSLSDEGDLATIEDEGRDVDAGEGLRTETTGNEEALLTKTLDLSACYEPFLQTEGPKLTWLREIVKAASTNPRIDHRAVSRASKSDVLVYKTLGKDLRSVGGRNVLVTVLLSCKGAAHITCHIEGEPDERIVALNNFDLDNSKLLRRDLPVMTPKWADWIITRVRCDSRLTFYLDLTDAEGYEKRVVYSETIQVCGNCTVVEMVALESASSLFIYAREIESSTSSAEILLRADDLHRLAVSLDEWSSENDAHQDISSLFDDQDFLRQILSKTNVIRLGMSCATILKATEDSLPTCSRPATSTSVSIDTPVDAVVSVDLLDSPSYIKDAFEENYMVGTVAFLAHAFVENGILSTLRHFQQQEAVRLNVAAFMQQAATIEIEAAFNERVERNLEAARSYNTQFYSATVKAVAP